MTYKEAQRALKRKETIYLVDINGARFQVDRIRKWRGINRVSVCYKDPTLGPSVAYIDTTDNESLTRNYEE